MQCATPGGKYSSAPPCYVTFSQKAFASICISYITCKGPPGWKLSAGLTTLPRKTNAGYRNFKCSINTTVGETSEYARQ